MSAQRRDADRKTAESVERVWQVYADEIGIPRLGEAEGSEPRLPTGEDLGPPPRPARGVVTSRRPLVGVAVVVVIGIAGIALWRGSPGTPPSGERRPTTVASAPAPETQKVKPADTVGPPRRPSSSDTPAARPADPAPPARPAVRPDIVRPGAPGPAVTRPASTVNFDFGSDRITEESKPTLDRLAVAMKANRDWRIVIEGHTDRQGTAEYNRELSERRAQAVKAYLQSAGIAPERLSAAGFGAARPAAPSDARGDAVNRRVDLHRR